MSIVESSCLSGFVPYEEVKCDGCSNMKLNKYELKEEKFVAYLNDVSKRFDNGLMRLVKNGVHINPVT
jgi:hypothetical protein